MDAFNALRRQAELRRNQAIKDARRKCREMFGWINALERQLTPPEPTKPESNRQFFCGILCRVMPKNREFTCNELTALAKEAAPARRFTRETVRSSLAYLELAGRVRRTRKIKASVLWAAPEFIAKPNPYGVRTIADVAEEVLRGRGALPILDLLVAIRESGYRADDDPRMVKRALAAALYRNQQFRRDGKRWTLAGQSLN